MCQLSSTTHMVYETAGHCICPKQYFVIQMVLKECYVAKENNKCDKFKDLRLSTSIGWIVNTCVLIRTKSLPIVGDMRLLHYFESVLGLLSAMATARR